MYDLQEGKEVNLEMIEDLLTTLEKKVRHLSNLPMDQREKPNRFIITGACIERGLVQFSVLNTNLCTNEKCNMCSAFRKAMENTK